VKKLFELKCLKCEEKIVLKDKDNLEKSKIKIIGEPEAQFGADVFILCDCGNEVDIDNKYS
jgi:hypothetical protein